MNITYIEELMKKDLPIIQEYDDRYDGENIEKVLNLCESEDPVALYELGARYRIGEGVEKNIEKAKELFEKVLLFQKHLRAIYWLGDFYNDLYDDKELARKLWETGSELGDGNCSESLADVYRFGDGVEFDDEKAIELYTKAITQGNKGAYLPRGEMYISEEKTVKQGFIDFTCAYKESDDDFIVAFAAYRIGQSYHEGWGVETDQKKAKEYLEEAVEYGIDDAYGMFGFILGLGLTGEKDIDKAFEYFDMMVDEAQSHNLKGRVYLASGEEERAVEELKVAIQLGSEQARDLLDDIQSRSASFDFRTASIDEVRNAYNKGNKKATYILARIYRKGERGANKDLNTAIDYLQEVITYDSPDLGTGHAYSDLSLIYLNGENGSKEYAKALEYALKSLEYTKLVTSYITISRIYDEGLGVAKDYGKAIEYAKKGIQETDDGHAYSWFLYLICRGNVEGERANEVVECIEKCLERTPNDAIANHYLGQFYMHGIHPYVKDPQKAVECLEISGEVDDYINIGDIYSTEEYGMIDYPKAVEYYKRAWDKGSQMGAAAIVGLELAEEFQNETWIDGRLGVTAGKFYLANAANNNNLKIICFLFIVLYLERIYAAGDENYTIQQYRELFGLAKRMVVSIENEDQEKKLSFCMTKVINGLLLPVKSDHEAIKILESVEELMDSNKTMGFACREAVGNVYCYIGKSMVEEQMNLEYAKRLLEKSAFYGIDEGRILGEKIKKNLFGKWVIK